MSNAEHYFENLILHGSDEVANDANKNALSEDTRIAVEDCYYYLIYNLFTGKKDMCENSGLCNECENHVEIGDSGVYECKLDKCKREE